MQTQYSDDPLLWWLACTIRQQWGWLLVVMIFGWLTFLLGKMWSDPSSKKDRYLLLGVILFVALGNLCINTAQLTQAVGRPYLIQHEGQTLNVVSQFAEQNRNGGLKHYAVVKSPLWETYRVIMMPPERDYDPRLGAYRMPFDKLLFLKRSQNQVAPDTTEFLVASKKVADGILEAKPFHQ